MTGNCFRRWLSRIKFVIQAENTVPFVCQALLLADDVKIDKVLAFLTQALKLGEDILVAQANQQVVIYDPIPMAVMKVADKERGQLLVEASSRGAMGLFLKQWYRALSEIRSSVHWTMDVDPIDV